MPQAARRASAMDGASQSVFDTASERQTRFRIALRASGMTIKAHTGSRSEGSEK
jgi:hypothetical protein